MSAALEPLPEGAPTDAQVVERVRAGDLALFEVLMRRHNQRVYRAIRSILRDEAEVEDVMQQAYVAAYAHLDQFQGASLFSTWLVRIAVNEALGRKRRARRLVGLEAAPDAAVTSPDQEEQAVVRELAAIVEGAIDALPEMYRTVLVLREVEGMSTSDTAQALGVSEEVVKTRLHRAKRQVRDALDERVGAAHVHAFPFRDTRCNRVVDAVMERLRSV